jgi:hypothetical protein
MTGGTSLENKADILADFWLEYKGDEQFKDFFLFNDLGLPLAYAVSHEIVASSEAAQSFIAETFNLLLGIMELEDEGFESLEDIVTRYKG